MTGASADLKAIQSAHDAHVGDFPSFSSKPTSHLLHNLTPFHDNLYILGGSAAQHSITVVPAEVTGPSWFLRCAELEINRVDKARGNPLRLTAWAEG
jgi:hypothetical protein